MKRMVLVLFVFFIAQISVAQAGVIGALEGVVLGGIEDQSPAIWDIEVNDDYVPQRGGIKVCKAENTLIVGFYLSEKNMEFYVQKFSDGQRKPLGFEIDVIDHDRVFDDEPAWVGTSSSLLPAVLYEENHLADNRRIHTVAVRTPTQLNSEKWYFVAFHFSGHHEKTPGKFEIQVQLVGDMEKLRNDYGNLYSRYTSIVRDALTPWLLANYADPGSTYFNIRTPRASIFWGDRFFADYDRVLWYMGNRDNKSGCGEGLDCGFAPYYCGFGDDPWDNPDSSEPPTSAVSVLGTSTYTPPPNTSDSDPGTSDSTTDVNVHIDKVTASKAGENNFVHEVTIYQGQRADIEADIENKGDENIYVDIGYYEDDDKNFGFDSAKKVGEDNDVKIDHGKRDNGQYENVVKHCNGIQFNTVGTFYLYVKVTTDGDSDYSSSSNTRDYAKVVVLPLPVTAKFSATPIAGTIPFTVQLSNLSTGPVKITTWKMNSNTFSNQTSPAVTITTPGIHTITLTVENQGHVSTASLNVFARVPTPPIADFSAIPVSGAVPLAVTFTDRSSNSPASWNWNFGDGATSAQKNPTHIYSQTGTFTITLIATNADGSDSETKVGYVTVTEPPPPDPFAPGNLNVVE